MDEQIQRSLKQIENRLDKLSSAMTRVEEKIDLSVSILRNQLIRIKNQEILSDDVILTGQPYNDLSPDNAFRVFSNETTNFMLLDVSSDSLPTQFKIAGSLHIPAETLPARWQEIPSKTVPIMVISEDGLSSILACEYLVQKGFFNLNNVSGGHNFWPAHKHLRTKTSHQAA